MRSAFCTVDKRCAMTTTVLPFLALSSADCTIFSDSVSSALKWDLTYFVCMTGSFSNFFYFTIQKQFLQLVDYQKIQILCVLFI